MQLAKMHGGDAAAKQVAILWAKSLGGDSAVKLLQKHGLLDEAIDYAATNGCESGTPTAIDGTNHECSQGV